MKKKDIAISMTPGISIAYLKGRGFTCSLSEFSLWVEVAYCVSNIVPFSFIYILLVWGYSNIRNKFTTAKNTTMHPIMMKVIPQSESALEATL